MSRSNSPQDICDAAWYYENNGSIDIILNPKRLGVTVIAGKPNNQPRMKKGVRWSSGDGICIRIPSAMLLATLKRQGKAK